MQITENKAKGLAKEFNIKVIAKDFDSRFEEKVKELAPKIKIDGFRPGKVPANIVKARHGERVRSELIEDFLKEATQKIVKDNKLRLATDPYYDFKEIKPGKDFECLVKFDVLPEIKATDLKKLSFKKYTAKVDAKDIKESLETLASQHHTPAPIKKARKTKKGDIAVINFDGKTADGPIQGGSGKDFELELGSNMFIPGFEDQLIGKDKGEKVKVEVKFPDNYDKKLAGKPASFDVEIKDICEKQASKIDDELAKKLGLKNLKELEDAINKELQRQNDRVTHDLIKQDILDSLDKDHKVELPESMVKAEFNNICHRILQSENKHVHSQKEFDAFAKEQEKEYFPIAERRVKLGLVLAEMAKEHGIKVEQKEVNDEVLRHAQSMPGREQEVIEFYQKNPQALAEVRAPLLEEKVINFIIDKAKVTTEEITQKKLVDMTKKREEALEKK
jgi:trigger factor